MKNILSISLDKNFFRKKKDSDVVKRQLQYVEPFDKLVIVTQADKRAISKPHKKIIVHGIPNRFGLDFLIRVLFLCISLIKKEKIRLITAQEPVYTGFVGLIAAKIRGIPFLLNIHGDTIDNPHWLQMTPWHYLQNSVGRFVIRRASHLRVVSNTIKKRLEKYNAKSTVAPTPINFTAFSSVNKKPENDRIVVLTIGSYVPEKNFDLILRVAKLLEHRDDIEFQVIGQGALFNKIRHKRDQMKLSNVVLLGSVPHDDIGDYYAKSHIYFQPTLFDGYAKVIQEAAYYMKAIVASDVSGTDYLIEHEKSGFLYDVDNAKQAAAGITYFTDEKNRYRCGLAARKKLQPSNSYKKRIKLVWNIWDSLLTSK